MEVSRIAKHVEKVRAASAARDRKMLQMQKILTNRSGEVFANYLSDDYPEPIIENTIRSSTEDLANMIGVLPSLRAMGATTLDTSKRSRSDKLSKIIGWQVFASNLGPRLPFAATQQIAHGFAALRVEPNFDERRPHMTVDPSVGTYYSRDRYRKLVTYFRVSRLRARELADLFPHLRGRIVRQEWGMGEAGEQMLDVVRFWDAEQEVMFLPQRDNLVLVQAANLISRIPVVIADGEPSDDGGTAPSLWDAIWTQGAKAELALLNMEAVSKAVQAPIAVPQDVDEFEMGPDAIIRTSQPRDVGRVGLDVPNSTMFEVRTLDDELKRGSHYPDVRAGFSDASVVTGKGVQALSAGFDQRVQQYQGQLGGAVADLVSLALEMDRDVFGSERREVYASVNGTSYEVSFTPAKDVYSTHVDAEYGLLAGLDPNRALVWSLQALGAGLVSKQWTMSNLPINLDVVAETKTMDVEGLRLAAITSLQSYAQAIPQMAAAGQDPTKAIKAIADVIADRQKGVPIEDAMAKAFTPPEPTPEEQAAMEQQAAMMAGGQPGMPGAPPAPGGAEIQAPYQPPTQAQLLTQLSGTGEPRTSARVVRQRVIA